MDIVNFTLSGTDAIIALAPNGQKVALRIMAYLNPNHCENGILNNLVDKGFNLGQDLYKIVKIEDVVGYPETMAQMVTGELVPEAHW